jgi:hypothetical protein
MSNLPQPFTSFSRETCDQDSSWRRPVRIKPDEFTPAVLRSEDGSCTSGELALFSLTGGLLSLPRVLHEGSRAKLMFLTQTGPVLGVAELLPPVSWTEQPFRFVNLHEDYQHRLWTAVQPAPKVPPREIRPNSHSALETLAEVDREQQWIDKYRSAIDNDDRPRKRFPGKLFALLTAASLAIGLAYACQIHLIR